LEFSKKIQERMKIKELSTLKINSSNVRSVGHETELSERNIKENSEEVVVERTLPPPETFAGE
jgi:hypothetical protein